MENKELVIDQNQQDKQLLSAADLKSNIQLIQTVMKSIMKKDTHYGIIPGTQKNTLYKAGSEVILATFRIGVDPEIIDLSTSDEIRYQVRCRGVHITTGNVVGVGVGECSSNEAKYKWRKANGDKEFIATPENRRRIKYGQYETKQVRTEPADVANTVLKMAKKRAQVDLTLTATAASDIFTQDVEDMGDEHPGFQGQQQAAPVQQPQAQSAGNGELVTEGQTKLLYAKVTNSDKTQDAFFEQYGIADYKDLPKSAVNAALEWIAA